MPPQPKRVKQTLAGRKTLKRKSQSIAAVNRRRQRKLASWRRVSNDLDDLSLTIRNKTGKERTKSENNLIILSLLGFLRRAVANNEDDISWTKLERMCANDLHVRVAYITNLRKMFQREELLLEISTNKNH